MPLSVFASVLVALLACFSPLSGITSPQTAKLIVDYSPIGRVAALRVGDGERIDFDYDRMGNVVSKRVRCVCFALNHIAAHHFAWCRVG